MPDYGFIPQGNDFQTEAVTIQVNYNGTFLRFRRMGTETFKFGFTIDGSYLSLLCCAQSLSARLYYGNDMYDTLNQYGALYGVASTITSSYTSGFSVTRNGVPIDLTLFPSDSFQNLVAAMNDGNWTDPGSNIPITYYLTNCSAPSAPTSVQPGGTVSFPVTVEPGYNIFNPVQGGSISVYQGNDYIPFTFENGRLMFTAPGGG